VIGPVAEAECLYVNQLRLAERAAACQREFVVWDVGLGAAANAIAALRATRQAHSHLRVISFDHTLEPLRFALQHSQILGYFHGYEPYAHQLLNDQAVRFHDGEHQVSWEVRQSDFPSLIAQWHARQRLKSRPHSHPAAAQIETGPDHGPVPDAIFYDAFSPAKNAAMWTLRLFQQLYQLLDPGRPCALATYSRSTLLRVTLLVAGFHVGAGHATGEKEETTLAANDPGLITDPLTRVWLQRARRSTSGEPLREPLYRQAPLSQATWEQLLEHPQFR
jgi:tRNA U34 5-methylaminomethyl-2-thiouridine-forming methyltransferase MnmC